MVHVGEKAVGLSVGIFFFPFYLWVLEASEKCCSSERPGLSRGLSVVETGWGGGVIFTFRPTENIPENKIAIDIRLLGTVPVGRLRYALTLYRRSQVHTLQSFDSALHKGGLLSSVLQ